MNSFFFFPSRVESFQIYMLERGQKSSLGEAFRRGELDDNRRYIVTEGLLMGLLCTREEVVQFYQGSYFGH